MQGQGGYINCDKYRTGRPRKAEKKEGKRWGGGGDGELWRG